MKPKHPLQTIQFNRSLVIKFAWKFMRLYSSQAKTWTVLGPFLIFGYQKYKEKAWLDTWKKLEHFPKNDEVIRNLPIRNPLIWVF